MKVEVNEEVNRSADVPVIVKHKECDLFVLKTASNNDEYSTFTGVVLYAHKKISDRHIGDYAKDWDGDQFDLFHGNIVLSND
jgi:hypothetical protein